MAIALDFGRENKTNLSPYLSIGGNETALRRERRQYSKLSSLAASRNLNKRRGVITLNTYVKGKQILSKNKLIPFRYKR